MKDYRWNTFDWNPREFRIGIIGISLFYLPLMLLSYPSSLGLVEIAVCIFAAIVSGISICSFIMLFEWIGLELLKLDDSVTVIEVCLSPVILIATIFWIGPFFLYPVLDSIIRGSIQFQAGSLLGVLALILGIISSIITIYEFLTKRRNKAQ